VTAFGDRARTALIAVATGAGLGIASQLVVRLPNPLGLLGTLAGPWLATAFAVGAVARSRRSAWWAGAASMAAAIVAYYVLRWVINPDVAGGVTVRGQAIPYLVIGLVAGAGMGILGALWRTGTIRWNVLGPGLLAGALGAEVIVLSTRAWRGDDLVLAVAQGAAAVAAAWFLPGGRLRGLAACAVGIAAATAAAGIILAADLPLRLFR
jgi:hypothetical protein